MRLLLSQNCPKYCLGEYRKSPQMKIATKPVLLHNKHGPVRRARRRHRLRERFRGLHYLAGVARAFASHRGSSYRSVQPGLGEERMDTERPV